MAGRKKSSEAGAAERAPWSVVVKAVFKDAMVLDPELPGASLRVGLRLMHYFDMDGTWQAWPARETLANDLQLSVEGVRKATMKLEATGWFTVDRTPGGRYPGGGPYRSNLYEPQWRKIGEFMPERWRQLEALAAATMAAASSVGTPNAGWGMEAGEPPTGVSRNPQPALDGTPNGSTPNLLNRTPRKELPDAAARPASVSFNDQRPRGSAANANSRRHKPSAKPKEDVRNLPTFFDGSTDIGSALRGEVGRKQQRRNTPTKADEKPRPQLADVLKDGRY